MPATRVAVAESADGLCLAATGAGHVLPEVIPPLEHLTAAGVPLGVTTRCHEGRPAREAYGFRGSEIRLQDLGGYYRDLDPPKTRIETIVAIAANELDEAFDRPGRRDTSE